MDDDELRTLLRDYLTKEDFCALHLEMLQLQALKSVEIAELANPGVKTWVRVTIAVAFGLDPRVLGTRIACLHSYLLLSLPSRQALIDHKDLPGAIASLDEALPTLFDGNELSTEERTSMRIQGNLNAKG